MTDRIALIQTADFITPVVDDPYMFGQIAVANALSDIYAMGGTPITAINLLMFASCKVPENLLPKILQGGADKLKEAEVSLIGGHTVDDLETKYGLSVTGIAHPEKIIRNSTARPGDILYYTKPLGIGVITTAIKADMAKDTTVEKATKVMSTLNKKASEIMTKIGANACTDITGFGFLGHTFEMAKFSHVDMEIFSENFSFLPQSFEFAQMGLLPAATYENIEYVGDNVSFASHISEELKLLLFDPQTSGGLLISVPPEHAEKFERELKNNQIEFSEVGVVKEGKGKIHVK
ncbi:selenophosphate synthase [Desulfurobacterium atlanticum]|uniref:Selenophosphate synthase n=1 Tax=Desulfurobacterium atlanticum TaxID=240169 RepID=A0A238YY17_9BACT|nr:selenophosphate synthase [Desulfurobacterium atlanticum]